MRSADCDVTHQGGLHAHIPNETSPKGPYTLSRLSVNDYYDTASHDDRADTINKGITSFADFFSQLVYLPMQLANCTTIIKMVFVTVVLS